MNPDPATHLGLAHFSCLGEPPVRFARSAAEAGFVFIGLRLHPFAPGTPWYSLPSGSADQRDLLAIMRDTGLHVFDIETVVIDQAFDPSTLGEVLDQAHALGAKRLNVCADDWDRPALVDKFAALCALAGDAGLGVDIESMAWRGINTLQKCVDLVTASGAGNAGVLIDALHLNRCGSSPADVAALPPGLVTACQLCDASAVKPSSIEAIIAEARGGRLAPGEGGLPLKTLVGALPSQTPLSLEIPMTSDEPLERRLPRFYRQTRALLAGAGASYPTSDHSMEPTP